MPKALSEDLAWRVIEKRVFFDVPFRRPPTLELVPVSDADPLWLVGISFELILPVEHEQGKGSSGLPRLGRLLTLPRAVILYDRDVAIARRGVRTGQQHPDCAGRYCLVPNSTNTAVVSGALASAAAGRQTYPSAGRTTSLASPPLVRCMSIQCVERSCSSSPVVPPDEASAEGRAGVFEPHTRARPAPPCPQRPCPLCTC